MPQTQIQTHTLVQLSAGQDWRLTLAHERDHHLLIWITRGQGRLLLDGQRRGISPHNALWIPARSLFALELGYQCLGHAVLIPEDRDVRLPEMPRQLRIRDGVAQFEIAALIEKRNQARADKDFAESDRIRDELAEAGVVLEDGAGTTTWRRAG